ncbi:MAG TPA: type II toxin-antitoxin system RelE/ParE family toxin [Terriglobales bacterium]|nr:type II toxin-antitoxin system RelE/ParE family toxin [Terriglobales bacterium]
MRYSIAFRPAALRSLESLPRPLQERIWTAIGALADAPYPPGAKKLKGPERYWRIRVGDYRVVYDVQHERLVVLVVRVGHRREVYR